MTAPIPERPHMPDDLDQAYARAHALAGDEREPAAWVRANVLAAAAQAEAKPPLVPVAAPVADVGGGRSRAWNQLSWRVRSGATFCALVLAGLAALRFDASRQPAADVRVAAAGSPPSPAPLPAHVPPPMEGALAGGIAKRQAAEPAVPVDAAPAVAAREQDEAARHDAERLVAQADQRARAQAAPDPPTVVVAAPMYAPAPARVESRLAAVAPPARAEPATGVAQASGLQRAEVGGAVVRAQPTPLHVAANADDVAALERLLADPSTRVDATDADGRTPLQYAVVAGQVRAVRMLLAAGADPDHADSAGASPRSVARVGPSAEIAALLAARR